jgi:hypothetical protein
MKVTIRISDVVTMARRFEESPKLAMREIVEQVHAAVGEALEQAMNAEIDLFLGKETEARNKRNGYTTRSFGIKGVVELRDESASSRFAYQETARVVSKHELFHRTVAMMRPPNETLLC